MTAVPRKTPPPSAWLMLALTSLPVLATVAFMVGAIVLLTHPPEPGDELSKNAWLGFILSAGITGAVASLGVLISVGLTKERSWSRAAGLVTCLVAAALIMVALGTGANDATPAAFVFGGTALSACVVTAALIATGR